MSNRISSRQWKLTIDTRPRKLITAPPQHVTWFPSVPNVPSIPSVPSVLGRAVTRASPSTRASCPSTRVSCQSAQASPSTRSNPMELYQTTTRAAQALRQLLGLPKHSGNCSGCSSTRATQALGLPKCSGNCSGCSSTRARQKTAQTEQEKLPKK